MDDCTPFNPGILMSTTNFHALASFRNGSFSFWKMVAKCISGDLEHFEVLRLGLRF